MLMSDNQCESPRVSKEKDDKRDASVGIMKDSKAYAQLLSSKGKDSH